MKKNIILIALIMSMIINPCSVFAETDKKTESNSPSEAGDSPSDDNNQSQDTQHETEPDSQDNNNTPREDGDSPSDNDDELPDAPHETEPETPDNNNTPEEAGDSPSDDDETQNPSKEEEDIKYTLTFLDFDGEILQETKVTADEKIDYSEVDVSGLHSFVNTYTEQDFNTWSSTPEYISEDTTIQALWKKGSISTKGSPDKTEYYSKNADIDFNGLSVIITLETQTPETDKNGEYIVETQESDITDACYPEKSLDELFSEEKNATMNVIPTGDDKPIFTYEITLFDNLGDTNNDSMVDAVDASFILETYAILSTSGNNTLTDEQKKICDINHDGVIDAVDATYVLIYYSEASTNGKVIWENLLES
ncbi:MAG: hypothetical protein K2G36_00105 [Ruminococcus sp.]|nr:hypothetical protein [Ruminococcus sp.]